MALTAAQLATALKLDATDAAELADVTRLLGAATALIEAYAPTAPDAIVDEAVVRVCGYLYDSPTAARGTAFGSALRNSGAGGLLLPWRAPRAVDVAD